MVSYSRLYKIKVINADKSIGFTVKNIYCERIGHHRVLHDVFVIPRITLMLSIKCFNFGHSDLTKIHCMLYSLDYILFSSF